MKEKIPEIINKKEFSYKDGIEHIIGKVNQLLSKKNYVVISISGRMGGTGGRFDSTNVGKTTLQQELCKKLGSAEIAVEAVSNLASIKDYKFLPLYLKQSGYSKLVIITGAESSLDIPGEKRSDFKKYRNLALQKAAEQIGLKLDGIDMNILIYRPDKPITKDEFKTADIVIKNEYAIDK